MKNFISLKDKRLAYLIIGAAASLIIFVLFIHLPKSKSVAELKSHIKNIEQQIAATEAMLGDIKKLGQILVGMQKELSTFEARIPDRENISSVLAELLGLAKACSIEVVSIKPEEPAPFLDNNKETISLDKKPLKNIVVRLKLQGPYKSIADYIRNIQESLNILATIDEVTITKDKKIMPKLNAEIVLNVYITD
jgi:Tfp pilus assembly protein PilO